MGMVVLLCLFGCLSSLYSSSRVCRHRALLRSVCRICFALSLPSLVGRLGLGLGPDPASRCGLV
jgi:hypothetical protein